LDCRSDHGGLRINHIEIEVKQYLSFSGKQILVIGAKRSGLAAAALLRKHGAAVQLVDSEPLTPEVIAQEKTDFLSADYIVLSPGVPYDLPPLLAARAKGIPTIGEVELSSYFLQGPIIGITGSNGKTTTTALTGHLLKEAGLACQVGGNIGTAVTSLIDSSSEDQWNVLELSSFQLESIRQFHARISACLNVTPDHLDRHHTFELYAAAKGRLFETQEPGDFAVLNYDDPTCRAFAERTRAQVFWFSSTQAVPAGVSLKGDGLLFSAYGTSQAFMRRDQIKLRGLHNVENVMAAAALAHLAGAKLEAIGPAVESFPGVEHRIELVRELNGVEYYNDSKATNVDASLKAIDAFPRGLWIILGGKDKGSDYAPLSQPLHERAKAALLIGAPEPYPYAAAPLIKKSLNGAVELVECGTLDAAVAYARSYAVAGDTVLLSPACASFDQFQNYEERGKRFKQLVLELF
jgi:UDP-N-acetylmuramoylalanine--D-glutamate ligase